jgi:class 3 adenylate cyclase
LLDELAPGGFFYGGCYIVEFDPDSLWYEASVAMAALALKRGTKVEYHFFQHLPSEVGEAFLRLGVDATKLEQKGLLRMLDSYTQTMEYEDEKNEGRGPFRVAKTSDKALDLVKSAEEWAKQAKAGYSDEDKRWIHIDDNTGIFLRYNDEKTMVDKWRTGILPYSVRARETPHFLAFAKGVASASFYSQFEASCDGIIELKAQEEAGGFVNSIRIRILRGKKFDSRWHRIELTDDGQIVLEVTRSEEARRLAAIMFTDIVGYTAMTQANESLALNLLKKHRELLRPLIVKYGGKEVKTIGDAFLVEFASALAATECAADVQNAVRRYDEDKSEGLQVRIGIHVGDVIHEGGDVYGDAVNIASRIEPLAWNGGVCISQQVYDQVRNKTALRFSKLEARELKNVSIPIQVYRLELQ